MSNRRKVQLFEDLTDYTYSLEILIVGNASSLRFIDDDIVQIAGFAVKLDIFHLDPKRWFSSNPDFSLDAFKKLKAVFILFDKEDELALIQKIWTIYLVPAIEHHTKIPKLLIDVAANDCDAARRLAVGGDMKLAETANAEDVGNAIQCVLEPLFEPIWLYLVDGYLRNAQSEYHLDLPLDVIAICRFWLHPTPKAPHDACLVPLGLRTKNAMNTRNTMMSNGDIMWSSNSTSTETFKHWFNGRKYASKWKKMAAMAQSARTSMKNAKIKEATKSMFKKMKRRKKESVYSLDDCYTKMD